MQVARFDGLNTCCNPIKCFRCHVYSDESIGFNERERARKRERTRERARERWDLKESLAQVRAGGEEESGELLLRCLLRCLLLCVSVKRTARAAVQALAVE